MDKEDSVPKHFYRRARHGGLPGVMICLSWNCRGLSHLAAIPFLCELVQVRRPDVFFLSETLSLTNKIEEVSVCLVTIVSLL